jgi:ATP-dependent Clp protease protease subunit
MTEHIIHFHCQIDQSTTERFHHLVAIEQGATSLLLHLSTSGGGLLNYRATIRFSASEPAPT